MIDVSGSVGSFPERSELASLHRLCSALAQSACEGTGDPRAYVLEYTQRYRYDQQNLKFLAAAPAAVASGGDVLYCFRKRIDTPVTVVRTQAEYNYSCLEPRYAVTIVDM